MWAMSFNMTGATSIHRTPVSTSRILPSASSDDLAPRSALKRFWGRLRRKDASAGGVGFRQFVGPRRVAHGGIDGDPVHDGLRRVAWPIQRGVEVGEFKEDPFADLARRWVKIDRRFVFADGLQAMAGGDQRLGAKVMEVGDFRLRRNQRVGNGERLFGVTQCEKKLAGR